MKCVIIGYGRHGKDTLAEMLGELGFSFESSSWHAAEHVVYPVLKELYGYSSVEECFNDRSNHRKEWFDLIHDYNAKDKTRLARSIFRDNDIYVGLRNRLEFEAIRDGLNPLFVWVDRSKVLPPEDVSSNELTPEDANLIVDNNHSLGWLRFCATKLAKRLRSESLVIQSKITPTL